MTVLPVLGLFQSEAELRDHVAANLATLEAGLELADREYTLLNPAGAGGRIDILALDRFDHVVVIEIKRSDHSARSTLNELAKYIALLINEARVPKEAIRCFVLSTDWEELRLPFSFFAGTAGVHVEGLRLVRAGDSVAYEDVELVPIADQPQLSPEVSIYHYPTPARRESHLAEIARRAEQLPFVRLAMLRLDPPQDSGHSFIAIGCVWRLKLGDEDRLEPVIGAPVGHLFPYGYPGWEAECDALFWLADEPYPADCFSSAEDMRGTPEKIASYLTGYLPAGVARHGDWPKLDLINTEERILRQLAATSSLTSSPRANRHVFSQSLNPRIKPSWRRGVDAFLAYIGFEPVWADAARAYLEAPFDPRAVVHLHARDKPNLFFLLHQVRAHPEALGPLFEIFLSIDGEVVESLVGHWGWDGETHPDNAEADIVRAFGSIAWCQMSCFSAVDERRYEQAYYDLGFRPHVLRLGMGRDGQAVATLVAGRRVKPWQAFVSANPDYMDQVAKIFGDFPTGPPSFQPR